MKYIALLLLLILVPLATLYTALTCDTSHVGIITHPSIILPHTNHSGHLPNTPKAWIIELLDVLAYPLFLLLLIRLTIWGGKKIERINEP